MFCPSCGLQETQSNQFCRACGNDLRPVRGMLENPDSITVSATSARDEIGQAFASRINAITSAKDLHLITEKVLPEIEKFLESPEERRLRTVRAGSMVSFVGLGAMIGFYIASFNNMDMLFFAALGFITFFIGLSLVVNGLFFTVPKKLIEERSSDAESQRQLDNLDVNTNELLMPPTAQSEFSSVTEHTTKHLKNKKTV